MSNMHPAEWINLFIAVITGLVCFATFKILTANRETVTVMREQIRASTRPYIEVSAWIRPGESVIMLSIKNTGNSGALNLKLAIDQAFYRNAEKQPQNDLRNLHAFKEIAASFGPRTELKFFLGAGHTVFGNPELCPPKFTVEAKYNFAGEQFVERTVVDLSPFLMTDVSKDPITVQLEKLNATAATLVKKMG